MAKKEFTSINPSRYQSGALAVKRMRLEVQRSTRKNFDINIAELSVIVANRATGDAEYQAGFTAALAEFIGHAIEGSNIVPENWQPLVA